MTRIPALDPAAFSEEQKALVGEWTHLEFSRVLINSPRMYGTFVPWLKELIAGTALPARDRQIVCLRMLELCGEVYEKTHHAVISRKCGLNDEEINAFICGEGDALTADDRDVLTACDELYRDQRIGDATWARLSRRYSQEQMMEIVFLAGCYQTMALLTKSFGIQLEPDLESFNALRDYADQA
ncbi:carboxymuconolactone decarboxylase family protein [Novosphingobium beihaiensis]|uniref:Carboxymuconolactone decarboxylase family protein n=1 Tax=Novosphingobium beihaiensis TaxID=2930389 RepID=A0ABT0BMK5_9SPHN|nr:carboxymuconolactone decarboxylase family protein [Novosphingobium beihaiensis]MCJ2186287.1 carboxymuconolactone decarboxylase family protein [Novosphingobium beihaiensis]